MQVSKAQPLCQAGAAELFLHTNLFQGSSSGASLGACRPASQLQRHLAIIFQRVFLSWARKTLQSAHLGHLPRKAQ